MHLHAGVLDFAVFGAMMLILGFIFRWIETRYSDKPIGKALSVIY